MATLAEIAAAIQDDMDSRGDDADRIECCYLEGFELYQELEVTLQYSDQTQMGSSLPVW